MISYDSSSGEGPKNSAEQQHPAGQQLPTRQKRQSRPVDCVWFLPDAEHRARPTVGPVSGLSQERTLVKQPCPPSAEHLEREGVPIASLPQSGGKRRAVDAVAGNGCAGVPRTSRFPNDKRSCMVERGSQKLTRSFIIGRSDRFWPHNRRNTHS